MKNITIYKIIIAIYFTLIFVPAKSQNFYDVNTIQEIEIQFSQANWDYILDSLKNSTEDYLMADWVKINGVQYDSAGVKFKGNSSYDSLNSKNPLNISLDKFKSQKHLGYENIKLSNGYGDPSCIREVLGYSILQNYMHCPKGNFAKVTINGNYYGLFSSAENIDKKFLGDHFFSSTNTFIKCNPTGAPTPAQKSNLKYLTANQTDYTPFYELKSDTGWADFIGLCNTISNNSAAIENVLDMDRTIWMLAYNNLFVNLDSYNGVYAQNHYTYKDNTGHFNPIVWDLNMCFGAFPYAGTGTIGVGQKTLTELKNYSPFAHATESAWPLINIIQANSHYKRKYLAHFKAMLTEQIVNNNYQNLATQLQSTIDTAIANDTNKLFTYAQFQNGLSADVSFGSFTVPGIANLLDARKTYLQMLPELIATEPTINAPVFSTASPSINANVNITVAIGNANTTNAYIGYRFSVKEKFVQLPLFDDGTHNDGAANDGQFGTSFTMSGAMMQYYIYAENDTIGKFLPAKAEHEFLKYKAAKVAPLLGDIVINEFLANNLNYNNDEYNDNEDWIELYNKTNNVIDVSTLYLSNTVTNYAKWKLPNETTIMPNAYLTIFADNDSLEQILHTNFSLNKDTGIVILSNGTSILDSVSYHAQGIDTSFGRLPNGTGNFVTMIPTFGYANNNFALGIPKYDANSSFVMYPNPASNTVALLFKGEQPIQLTNAFGKTIFSINAINSYQLNCSNLPNGLYIVSCGGIKSKLMVQH